jgi:hypothetical protein
MTRLCSVMIPFKNQQYPALISVRNSKEEVVCQVRYISKDLPFILSGETLLFCPTEGLKPKTNLPPEFAAGFVQTITQAIATQLKTDTL